MARTRALPDPIAPGAVESDGLAEHIAGRVPTRDLSHFVQPLGASLLAMNLAVDGIHCPSCMGAIERGLLRLPGIRTARVNLANRRLRVEWESGATSANEIIDRLSALGFSAQPFAIGGAEMSEAHEERRLMVALAVAGFAAMNIMLLSVAVWSGHVTSMSAETRDFLHWLSALIAVPAAAFAARPFYASAWRALCARSVNMDVPITLGVALALGVSVYQTFAHAEHAYFDSALMLLFFLLIGRTLDQRMRRRTRAVATNLASLKAETAVKFVSATEVSTVPIAAVRPGDLILVRPGERIAVDGRIEEGRSEVDQSLVTGETLPTPVAAGTMVYQGTLNLTAALRIRATAVETGTLLADVQALLERATEVRSRYRRLADRAAKLYAPVVHTAALATLIGWSLAGATFEDALITAISVLIITCPCALGLAIPAVQVVASGALFKRGLLLSSGDALERLAQVDMVAFDKTGTLTRPEAALLNGEDIAAAEIAVAGRLALSSRHPLAVAIARAAGASEPIAGAVEEPGKGVRAIAGVELRLGRPDYCDAEREAADVAARFPSASVIAFRIGERRLVFAVGQALRPDAAEVVAKLRGNGLGVHILSGDREAAVADAAHALGGITFDAALAPAGKIARLDAFEKSGRRVLMVGDGLNDAPALAAAKVSISPIDAAHITQAAADAVFVGTKLAPVAAAVAFGRRAHAIMLQNLWLAAGYNLVAVPLAIAGHATPLIAALAMSGSSLLVIGNALRAGRSQGV